jgi:hypothetical protein
MSPRKSAAAKAIPAKAAGRGGVAARATAKPAAKPMVKPVVKPAIKVAAADTASAEATKLAAEIERGLRDGRLDTLSPKAFQTLMATLCKSYGMQREAGADFLPLADRNSASPTEIMTMTSALLQAANLAVFELGMWQSWTGR